MRRRRVRSVQRARQTPGCLSSLVLALLVLGCAAVGVTMVAAAATAPTRVAPRLNVLILGLDRRPGEGYAVRSDTMIVLTAYPRIPHVGLISIPRDLYVDIPGYGPNRINTAHFWGENEAAGRGPALAMATVRENLGVDVHRYVRLDFDGFRAVVDAVGGVDIVVDEPIVDDAYPTEDYGTVRIEIPAGEQHMDGETALRYARSRHGASDFERAERQQRVMLALARRLLTPSAWPAWPRVLLVGLRHLDTDLRLGDILHIAVALQRVGPDGIERLVIDDSMTDPWTTPSGAAVLLPRWEAIRPAVQEMFTP